MSLRLDAKALSPCQDTETTTPSWEASSQPSSNLFSGAYQHSKKMMAMSVDPDRVRELEAELDGIRIAFKDYVASSRDLETGLDHELGGMRKFL
jgi:hypothetical protein